MLYLLSIRVYSWRIGERRFYNAFLIIVKEDEPIFENKTIVKGVYVGGSISNTKFNLTRIDNHSLLGARLVLLDKQAITILIHELEQIKDKL